MILDPVTALREALESEALDAFEKPGGPAKDELQSANHAALAVATALGHCRLRDLNPGDADGSLDPAMAIAAVEAMCERLDQASERARKLDDLMDETDSGIEMASLVEGLLDVAMDAWAVYVAVMEPWADALDRSVHPNLVGIALARLGEKRNAYDLVLQGQVDGLCFAADSHILEFWRSTLAGDYALAEPWWLDGTLERHAEQLEKEMSADGPDEETLRAFRCRVLPRLIPPFEATLLPMERPRVLAAAGARPSPLPDRVLDWFAPDQDLQARLRLPALAPDAVATSLMAQFMSRDLERIATELTGQVATLAGCAATIDEQGRAYWDLATVRAADRDLDLSVGGQRWIPWREEESGSWRPGFAR